MISDTCGPVASYMAFKVMADWDRELPGCSRLVAHQYIYFARETIVDAEALVRTRGGHYWDTCDCLELSRVLNVARGRTKVSFVRGVMQLEFDGGATIIRLLCDKCAKPFGTSPWFRPLCDICYGPHRCDDMGCGFFGLSNSGKLVSLRVNVCERCQPVVGAGNRLAVAFSDHAIQVK